ncbi:conserved hypothetical protein [Aeropyrum pernix K1]|uniref:Radical SAM core domain-containing protein n=1 Tax=Aeropyrum pernix (strain ATCC 700893 / DSM 11879 / JCM 9820 / NBRC 100138 / K1) TaxID=272557 RepID=Q9YCD0_AERPE|nr:radical SAM protein [Aeropyrum pernix]BAA80318.2 conserved hypothetical protein [Aeropyrum pernix K1]
MDSVKSLVDAVHIKRLVAEELRRRVGEEGFKRASRDWHARRRPIPCGMTIHTGVGCSYGCLYCYIYDMGFTGKPQPYPLSGDELALALALNPYVAPGPKGTLLAFGSVTEPFMRETAWRAIEYLESTRRWLGNPQQISTKTALRGGLLERFIEAADPRIDVLVSMTTLSRWKALEPGASPPEERIEFMGRLVEAGLSATLFLRPIIPGVTDREAEDILSRAARAGVNKVVLGTLRVAEGILRRLRASGAVEMGEIERRLPRWPRKGEQLPIYSRDLKERIASKAREMGFKVLPASCSANVESHGQGCAACRLGPCGDLSKLPSAGEREVARLLEALGLKPVKVSVRGHSVEAVLRGGRREAEIASYWIIGLLRRYPRVRTVRN